MNSIRRISSLAPVLAVLVLLLQLATVSPALHGILHGGAVAAHGCADGDGCGSGDDTERSLSPDPFCAVTLLAGGVDLPVGLCVPAVESAALFREPDPMVRTVPWSPWSLPEARAPPIL